MASMIKAWIFRLLGFQVFQGIRNCRDWKGTNALCNTYVKSMYISNMQTRNL